MASQKYEYTVPRSFRLRMELEIAEKGAHSESKEKDPTNKGDPHANWISYGLGDLTDAQTSYDKQLENWTGTIIGPQNTPLGERIYQIKIHCGPKYPDAPPTLQFVNKIAMPGVDDKGNVSGVMKSWKRANTIYDYLVAVRVAMVAAAKIKQPAADAVY